MRNLIVRRDWFPKSLPEAAAPIQSSSSVWRARTRSVVINLRAISHVRRHDNETAEIHVKGRKEVLPVSRGYLHLFRQM